MPVWRALPNPLPSMRMPDSSAARASLIKLKTMSLSSLRDTLTSRTHSRDFAFSRGDYLRSRVMVVSAIFLALLPFWTALDRFMLPVEILEEALTGRIIMLAALLLTFVMAHYSKARLPLAQLSAGLVLGIPAAFYALVLSYVPLGAPPLVGYNFIPYMLVTMQVIFPFTLTESAVLGTVLIALEAYALHVSGTLLSAAGA